MYVPAATARAPGPAAGPHGRRVNGSPLRCSASVLHRMTDAQTVCNRLVSVGCVWADRWPGAGSRRGLLLPDAVNECDVVGALLCHGAAPSCTHFSASPVHNRHKYSHTVSTNLFCCAATQQHLAAVISAHAISGSTIQNSHRWRGDRLGSARNAGLNVYTLPSAHAAASRCNCPLTVRLVRRPSRNFCSASFCCCSGGCGCCCCGCGCEGVAGVGIDPES